jgi:hypothetical protein
MTLPVVITNCEEKSRERERESGIFFSPSSSSLPLFTSYVFNFRLLYTHIDKSEGTKNLKITKTIIPIQT